MSKQRAKSAKAAKAEKQTQQQAAAAGKRQPFHLEFKNQAQKMAWGAFDQHDVLFLLGAPGTGKSHLAMAFAISEVLSKRKKKIVLTRPIVEAGESLGYLPGDINEKTLPYMLPLFDCMERCLGPMGPQRDIISKSVEVAPLAYMRGRAETLDSPLVTPTGLVPMGQIKVGDLVIGSDGSPIKVTGVFPQGKKRIFRVNFSDKTFVKCSEDHLWSTMTLNEKRHNKGFTVKTTKEISETVKNKHNQKIHRMPILSGPVQFQSREVNVDPYLLGLLLGDGHIRKGAAVLTTSESEIVIEAIKRIPHGLTLKKRSVYDYRIVSENNQNKFHGFLESYGLTGKKSHNKFIPYDYKFNSPNIRLEVLKGLLDSDGWISDNNNGKPCRIQYYSTSKQLAEDVMFLVRSLGGLATSHKREFDVSDEHERNGRKIRHIHPTYVIDIMMPVNPFRLSRKANRYQNTFKFTKLISSVEYIGEEECQCISVDAKNRLYLTNGFNITHNTFSDAVCIFDEAQNATYAQLKLFLSRFGENSKVIITGDPMQSDLHPRDRALMHVVDKLSALKGIGIINFKASSIVRHSLIGAIMEKLEGKKENEDAAHSS